MAVRVVGVNACYRQSRKKEPWTVGFVLRKLVVENNIKQRTMDLQAPAVVVNKAHFHEPVHEEADPRAGCTDYFRYHLLTDLVNYRLGRSFFAKMSEQQKDSG